MAENEIGPRPENAGQAGDNEDAFVIAKPNGKNDRYRVKKDEGNLMVCSQVEPADGEEQHQRLDKGERWRLANEKTKHTHAIRSSTLWEQISRQSLSGVSRFRCRSWRFDNFSYATKGLGRPFGR